MRTLMCLALVLVVCVMMEATDSSKGKLRPLHRLMKRQATAKVRILNRNNQNFPDISSPPSSAQSAYVYSHPTDARHQQGLASDAGSGYRPSPDRSSSRGRPSSASSASTTGTVRTSQTYFYPFGRERTQYVYDTPPQRNRTQTSDDATGSPDDRSGRLGPSERGGQRDDRRVGDGGDDQSRERSQAERRGGAGGSQRGSPVERRDSARQGAPSAHTRREDVPSDQQALSREEEMKRRLEERAIRLRQREEALRRRQEMEEQRRRQIEEDELKQKEEDEQWKKQREEEIRRRQAAEEERRRRIEEIEKQSQRRRQQEGGEGGAGQVSDEERRRQHEERRRRLEEIEQQRRRQEEENEGAAGQGLEEERRRQEEERRRRIEEIEQQRRRQQEENKGAAGQGSEEERRRQDEERRRRYYAQQRARQQQYATSSVTPLTPAPYSGSDRGPPQRPDVSTGVRSGYNPAAVTGALPIAQGRPSSQDNGSRSSSQQSGGGGGYGQQLPWYSNYQGPRNPGQSVYIPGYPQQTRYSTSSTYQQGSQVYPNPRPGSNQSYQQPGGTRTVSTNRGSYPGFRTRYETDGQVQGQLGAGNEWSVFPDIDQLGSSECPETGLDIRINGLDCQSAVRSYGAYLCYSHEFTSRQCCEVCLPRKQPSRVGCEYGDHTELCSTITPADCYDLRNRHSCCDTCEKFRRPGAPAGCEYGDMTSRCENVRQNPGLCYIPDNQRLCCDTCNQIKNTSNLSCAWGDYNPSLCQMYDESSSSIRLNCYAPQRRRICCESCERIREWMSKDMPADCQYGDRSVVFNTGQYGRLNCTSLFNFFSVDECRTNSAVSTNCCYTCNRLLSGRG
ncbi:unnamed protein product [Lymnaea stagnalis]|uniref:Uncharacterized protein n=1 Tax=Lymnaea stagnalis TaxID=6523 RepID=A0AAV2HUL8_LYMST